MDPLADLLGTDDTFPSKSLKTKKGAEGGLEEDEDIFDIISKKKDKSVKKKSIFDDSDSEDEPDIIGKEKESPLSKKSELRDSTNPATFQSEKSKTIDFTKLTLKEKKKDKNRTKDSKDKKINVISKESTSALNSILVTDVKTNDTDVFMDNVNRKQKQKLEDSVFDDLTPEDLDSVSRSLGDKTKTSTKVANIRIRSKENEEADDKKDSEFKDLMVGKILERENDSNFFDVSSQQKKEVPKQKPQVTTIVTESTRTVVEKVNNLPSSNERESQDKEVEQKREEDGYKEEFDPLGLKVQKEIKFSTEETKISKQKKTNASLFEDDDDDFEENLFGLKDKTKSLFQDDDFTAPKSKTGKNNNNKKSSFFDTKKKDSTTTGIEIDDDLFSMISSETEDKQKKDNELQINESFNFGAYINSNKDTSISDDLFR